MGTDRSSLHSSQAIVCGRWYNSPRLLLSSALVCSPVLTKLDDVSCRCSPVQVWPTPTPTPSPELLCLSAPRRSIAHLHLSRASASSNWFLRNRSSAAMQSSRASDRSEGERGHLEIQTETQSNETQLCWRCRGDKKKFQQVLKPSFLNPTFSSFEFPPSL